MKQTAVFNDLSDNVNLAHLKSRGINIDIHLHDCYEIFIALSDNIVYFVEGRSYKLSPGDVIITNEKEIHRPIITDSGLYERVFIQFKPIIFAHLFSEAYNPLAIFENRPLGQNNKIPNCAYTESPVYNIFCEMEELFQIRSAKNMLITKTLLIKLLSELEEQYHKNAQTKGTVSASDERVDKIINELNMNFTKNFNLDEISRRHFMDKYYMCHLFKEKTGFSLLEYIQSKRIQQAKALISEGKGIMEAARLSGFDEYSNFYKTFTKLVKLSPRNYKNSLEET